MSAPDDEEDKKGAEEKQHGGEGERGNGAEDGEAQAQSGGYGRSSGYGKVRRQRQITRAEPYSNKPASRWGFPWPKLNFLASPVAETGKALCCMKILECLSVLICFSLQQTVGKRSQNKWFLHQVIKIQVKN